ncbi:hypothetical protein F4803DRAFT_553848 [Xylaria telfairii]|nr:hypothetical protein F4803DRAFT_553848 [Xylaria telfairii]
MGMTVFGASRPATNHHYVLHALLARKPRGRTSWVHQHGTFFRCVYDAERTLGESFWLYRRCDEVGLSSRIPTGNTSTAAEHLKRAHRILRDSSNGASTDSTTPEPSSPPPPKRLCTFAASNITVNDELALGFMIDSNSPFDIFNNLFLRRTLLRYNSALYEASSWSRQYYRQRLDKLFKAKKSKIRDELQHTLSSVHIAFDLWTSPTR